MHQMVIWLRMNEMYQGEKGQCVRTFAVKITDVRIHQCTLSANVLCVLSLIQQYPRGLL